MPHVMSLFGNRLVCCRRERDLAPKASGKSPASTRRSVDFPAPLGPVTVRLSPASTANDRFAKMIRPPRSAVRLEAESRMMIKPWAAELTEWTFSSIIRVALGDKIIYKPETASPFSDQTPGKIPMTSLDSFKSRKKLTVGSKTYHYFSLKAAEKHGLEGVSALPFSMKILLENLLRFEDGRTVTKSDIEVLRRGSPIKARKNARSRFVPPAF